MNKPKTAFALTLAAVLAISFFGCRPGGAPGGEGLTGEIQVKGSDTLLLLA